jgi:predicted DNA-binding protein YlxM (UPF0122 family)
MGKSKTKEKDYCKLLYVQQRLSVEEILERVDVSERTLRKWIKDPVEDWDKLRKSLLITKQQQIVRLYDQLEWLNDNIASREKRIAEAKEADVISKLTSAIKKLEVETSIGEIIEVGRSFIDFIREIDLSAAKEVTRYLDLFINSKIK